MKNYSLKFSKIKIVVLLLLVAILTLSVSWLSKVEITTYTLNKDITEQELKDVSQIIQTATKNVNDSAIVSLSLSKTSDNS